MKRVSTSLYNEKKAFAFDWGDGKGVVVNV